MRNLIKIASAIAIVFLAFILILFINKEKKSEVPDETVDTEPVGAVITTENELIAKIATQQSQALSDTGKYKQIFKTAQKIDSKDAEYSITEYETSKRDVGYQIILEYPDRKIKSIGYGVEAQRRTYEILPVPSATSTLLRFFEILKPFYAIPYALAINTHTASTTDAQNQYFNTTATEVGIPSGNTDRSEEAWVQLQSGGVLRMITSYGSAATRAKIHWGISANNKQIIELHGEDALESNTALTVGVWYHVAYTYSTGVLTYYLNGSADGGDSSFGGAWATTDNTTFRIGTNLDQDVQFDGRTDDVRVWDDVRTATEILNNYNCSLVGNEAGLVAYWKLDNSLLDETTNNNDLTNNNSAEFQSATLPFTATCGAAAAVSDDTYFNILE